MHGTIGCVLLASVLVHEERYHATVYMYKDALSINFRNLGFVHIQASRTDKRFRGGVCMCVCVCGGGVTSHSGVWGGTPEAFEQCPQNATIRGERKSHISGFLNA